MGSARYDVLLVDANGEAKQQRDWTEKQLLDSVPWLKRMNARGHDVLIRPDARSGLILLDQMTKVDISKLERSGVPCCAKVEVELERFQIWLKLGSSAVSKRIGQSIAKQLEFPNPATRKFGVLAGFVKHHPNVQLDRHGFVLAHEPSKPDLETITKWEKMLEAVEKLVNPNEKTSSSRHSKSHTR